MCAARCVAPAPRRARGCPGDTFLRTTLRVSAGPDPKDLQPVAALGPGLGPVRGFLGRAGDLRPPLEKRRSGNPKLRLEGGCLWSLEGERRSHAPEGMRKKKLGPPPGARIWRRRRCWAEWSSLWRA
ncbi:hypothetical protein NDU88_000325 [Pleurodeles waltl]|uniref:Uncharacterized protein n=1 Tax=Pleurodeles waltl TaxID=8319 RepID=A0AAV7UQ68_PLEWA|nr:hypothetical protein NDU88_000325 [Pleurodeles waltl]